MAVYLHAYSMQQGFLFKQPVAHSGSPARYTFNCTRSWSPSEIFNDKPCGVAIHIINTGLGWTVEKFNLGHNHELKKESMEQIRSRGWTHPQTPISVSSFYSNGEGASHRSEGSGARDTVSESVAKSSAAAASQTGATPGQKTTQGTNLRL